jgi:hypothetical protein
MAEDTETTEIPDEQPNDSGPIKQLRAAEKAAKAEAREYRTLLMEGAYNQMGLDANEGLGKAIAKEYKGKPTAEALAEYAKEEYNYIPAVESSSPVAQEIATQQGRIDQAAAGAGSVAPVSQQDALAIAEAERDNNTTMAIKGQQIASWFGGNQGTR